MDEISHLIAGSHLAVKELLSAACFQTITESKLIQCTEIRYCVVLQDSVDSDAKVSLAGYQTEAEV